MESGGQDLEAIDWRWYERRSDTVLRLFYRYAGPPVRHICRVTVRETSETVEVALWMPAIDSKAAACRGCVDVPLRTPVGDLAVVDSSTGQPGDDVDALPPLPDGHEWDEHEWVRSARRGGGCAQVAPEYLAGDAGPS